jgi:hypothetical protein
MQVLHLSAKWHGCAGWLHSHNAIALDDHGGVFERCAAAAIDHTHMRERGYRMFCSRIQRNRSDGKRRNEKTCRKKS